MKNGKKLREWVTPITIGAFALSAVTGILLFFKVDLGLVKPIHEWLSWLLVFGAILHMIVNWRATVQSVSRPVGRGILVFFLFLLCLSFLPGGGRQERHKFERLSDILAQASLSEIAQIADHSSDDAVNILNAKGIYADNKMQTVQEIAAKNNKSPAEILDVIF